MKKLKILFVILILALITTSCDDTSQFAEATQVAQQQRVYEKSQPIPAFDWSLERDVLIQLYYARNEALSTYTVVVDSHGGTIYECPSIGFPIAADTQLTNPEQFIRDSNGNITMPQSEPNGLFNQNSFGTWVMCVLPDGTVYPYYTEMNAQAWPFPVERGEDGSFHQSDGSKPSKVLDITRDIVIEPTIEPTP